MAKSDITDRQPAVGNMMCFQDFKGYERVQGTNALFLEGVTRPPNEKYVK